MKPASVAFRDRLDDRLAKQEDVWYVTQNKEQKPLFPGNSWHIDLFFGAQGTDEHQEEDRRPRQGTPGVRREETGQA